MTLKTGTGIAANSLGIARIVVTLVDVNTVDAVADRSVGTQAVVRAGSVETVVAVADSLDRAFIDIGAFAVDELESINARAFE